MAQFGFEPWLGGGAAPGAGYANPNMKAPDAPPAAMNPAPTQNYWNYGGAQHQYAPNELVPYNQFNYSTGTNLRGNVPSYEAWAKQTGIDPNYQAGEGGQDPHDAYSQAVTVGLMNPQQFQNNIDRNRPQSGGLLGAAASGIIGAAGLPGGTSAVDKGLGSPEAAPQYNVPGGNVANPYLPGGGGNAERAQGGGILTDLLGVVGAGSQANAYGNYADWAKGVGQPYRDTLQGTYTNPMGYLSSPEVTGAVQQGTDALSRSLSMGGNPIGSGGALQQLQNYSTNQQLDRLAQYRQQLGGFGGLNAINQSIPGATNAAIGARGNVWNAGGALGTDIFRPGGVASQLFPNIFGNGGNAPPGYGSGVDQFGNPSGGGNFQGGPGSPGGSDFYNPGTDFGTPTQFDPSIDWSSLYG